MLSTKKDLPVKRLASKSAWEAWLRRHHETSAGLWLEMAKKGSGLASVSYAEAVEVALCYGWIDGQTASVDAKRYRQRFTPRRPRSKWSQINRAAAERLHAEGRVAPAGLRAIEAAHQDGRWTPIRRRGASSISSTAGTDTPFFTGYTMPRGPRLGSVGWRSSSICCKPVRPCTENSNHN